MVHDPFIVSTNRQLPPNHPVYKLLKPHFAGMAAINSRIPGVLSVAPGLDEYIDKCPINPVSIYADGAFKLVKLAYAEHSFEDMSFKNNLEKRGMLDTPSIKDYPYRDDGILYYDAIMSYVSQVLNVFYKSDADVANDTDIQNWAKELYDPKHGDVKGLYGKGKVKDVKCLVDIVGNAIFNMSVQHSAINYGQAFYYWNIPATPF